MIRSCANSRRAEDHVPALKESRLELEAISKSPQERSRNITDDRHLCSPGHGQPKRRFLSCPFSPMQEFTKYTRSSHSLGKVGFFRVVKGTDARSRSSSSPSPDVCKGHNRGASLNVFGSRCKSCSVLFPCHPHHDDPDTQLDVSFLVTQRHTPLEYLRRAAVNP